MAEPVTASIMLAAGVAKGVSGYKAGQASSKASQATALYNQQITQLNAQMEADAGHIERVITERNASDVAEQYAYNAFLLSRQAEEVDDQNEFDMFVAERQYNIFTAEKRAKWGTSGVTMAGSPAVVAMADAHAAAMNLANIEQKGLQALNRVNQASEMTEYEGKVKYNNLMQSAYMRQYASNIERAQIINQGNVDYYNNALQSYTAQQQATSALVSGIASGVSSAAGAYGGDLGSLFGGGGGSNPFTEIWSGGTTGQSGMSMLINQPQAGMGYIP